MHEGVVGHQAPLHDTENAQEKTKHMCVFKWNFVIHSLNDGTNYYYYDAETLL